MPRSTISQLGSIAPNLEKLTISSSLVVGREEKFAIIMPNSNLSSLIFRANFFDWILDEDERIERSELQGLALNEDKMGIEEVMYICIKMELFPWKRNYMISKNYNVKDSCCFHCLAQHTTINVPHKWQVVVRNLHVMAINAIPNNIYECLH